MNDDMELVREYVACQSEQAFETLVSRNVGLVHSAALRQLRDPHLAEEITQTVFIILARKAGSLNPKTILPGWLYRTTRYVSAAALKIQRRREQREQEAHMQAVIQGTQTDPAWEQFSPLLDEAMANLRDKDRDSIVLRYFQNQSLRDVGAALGVDEYAAQKRVARALEKLRTFFVKRGIDSTAATIAEAVSANSVQAAPALLAKSVTAMVVTKGAAASGSTLTLIKGALKIMAWAKAKTAIVIGAGVLMASVTATITVQEIESHGTLTIRMHVDGSDFLRVSGNQLWLEHAFYVRPDNPIYVNGRPWSPTWDGNVSTKYTGLKPAFNPHNPQRIQLAVTAGRGPVSIAHLPASDNNQTLSVLINDNDYDGQDWYEFTISW
jgi:RNA polymerase sigma factor (sigma-70 family)